METPASNLSTHSGFLSPTNYRRSMCLETDSCYSRDFDDAASYASLYSAASHRTVRVEGECTQRSPRAAILPALVAAQIPRNRDEMLDAAADEAAVGKADHVCRGIQNEHKLVCRLFARAFGVLCVVISMLFLGFAYLGVRFGLKSAEPRYTMLSSLCISAMALVCAYRSTEVASLLRRWDDSVLANCPCVSTTTLVMIAMGLFPTAYLLSLSLREIWADVHAVSEDGAWAMLWALSHSLSVSDFYALLPPTMILLTEYIAHVCKSGMEGIDSIWLAKQRFKVV